MKSQVEIEAKEAIKRAAIIADKEKINCYIATLKSVLAPHVETDEGKEMVKEIDEIIRAIPTFKNL